MIAVTNDDHKTDADLLKEFAEGGDQTAFKTLVKRHGALVHGVALRVLSNHHDAEDVTQAVFVTLAREAGRLGRKPSITGWLHTVSRHLSLNARQARASRQEREKAAMQESPPLIHDPSLRAGFRRELDAALAGLPERYREPLVLFHLEGASLHETARRLKLNPATLRTRLSRARQKLRGLLGRRGVELASVTALSTLLAAEGKAATVSPTILSNILEAAACGGGAASSTTLFSSLPSFAMLMKTKATLIGAVVLAFAALGTTAYLMNDRGPGPDQTGVSSQKNPGVGDRSPRSPLTNGAAQDPLAGIESQTEFEALVEKVLLIDDDTRRFAAIRSQLGLDLTEAQYREALAAYGYQINPMALFTELLEVWLDDDPRAVAQWTERFPGEVGAPLIKLALTGWLQADERSALAWAEDRGIEPGLVAELNEEAAKMRERLPLPESATETSEMLQSMHERLKELYAVGSDGIEERSRLQGELSSLLERWLDLDAGATVEFLDSLDSSARNVLEETIDLRSFIRKWGQVDPDAALTWAKTKDHPDERLEALAAILPSWQLKHPGQTIADAVNHEELPERHYHHLVGKIVRDWAVTHPPAAADYAMQLEEPKFRKEMVSTVVESWVRKDPDEVTQWALSQPVGELRDTGLMAASERLAMTDFSAGAELARQIGGRRAKDEAISQIILGAKGIRHHFDDALRLADGEMTELPFDQLRNWAHEVRPEDIPAFRSWLETNREAGRIQWHTPRQGKAVDPGAGFEFILKGLGPGS